MSALKSSLRDLMVYLFLLILPLHLPYLSVDRLEGLRYGGVPYPRQTHLICSNPMQQPMTAMCYAHPEPHERRELQEVSGVSVLQVNNVE